MNRFSFITILIQNMDESLEFYMRALGCEIVKKDHHPRFVLVQRGNLLIALHCIENLEKVESRVIPGIPVQDLARTVEEFNAKGVEIIHETPQEFFGGLYVGIQGVSKRVCKIER